MILLLCVTAHAMLTELATLIERPITPQLITHIYELLQNRTLYESTVPHLEALYNIVPHQTPDSPPFAIQTKKNHALFIEQHKEILQSELEKYSSIFDLEERFYNKARKYSHIKKKLDGLHTFFIGIKKPILHDPFFHLQSELVVLSTELKYVKKTKGIDCTQCSTHSYDAADILNERYTLLSTTPHHEAFLQPHHLNHTSLHDMIVIRDCISEKEQNDCLHGNAAILSFTTDLIVELLEIKLAKAQHSRSNKKLIRSIQETLSIAKRDHDKALNAHYTYSEDTEEVIFSHDPFELTYDDL